MATTIVYVDRQVFGILGPRLTAEFGWSETNFSFIMSAFTLSYAVGYSLVGRIMDAIGERKGFLLVFGVWSVAEIAHCLVNPLVYRGLPWLNAAFAGTFLGSLTPALLSVAGFSLARFSLGLVEGGHFPGAIKTVGQWNPKRERRPGPRSEDRGYRTQGGAYCGRGASASMGPRRRGPWLSHPCLVTSTPSVSASMGPRSEDRGYRQRTWRVSTTPACFNGSTVR